MSRTPEVIMNTANAINVGLAADGIHDIVCVPTTTMLELERTNAALAEALAKQVQAVRQPDKDDMFDPAPEQQLITGMDADVVIVDDGPRPEHLHLARDTAQDIVNGADQIKQARETGITISSSFGNGGW